MPQKQQTEWTVGVDAHGTATADYDRVAFTISADVTFPTMDAVKDSLKQKAAAFKELYASLEKQTEIDAATLSTNSALFRNKVYNAKKQDYIDKGYKGVFSATFEIKVPEDASRVYDALTNLDGFDVNAPEFKLRQQEELKRQALVNAHQRLMERFELECKVMGTDPNLYKIATWRVDYGRGGNRAMAKSVSNYAAASSMEIGASLSGDEIEIQASKAIVTVYLTVTFALK